MTGDCPICGSYMIDPVSRERCDRCEIARLREAIKREAEQHEHPNRYSPCDCQICMIAREEGK